MNARMSVVLVVRRAVTCAMLIGVCGSVGCETYRAPQYRKTSPERVATVDVAVLSVTPWERYKSKLQPAFKLSSAQAFQQAVPMAAGYETQVLRETAASLGIGINEDLTDDLADRGTSTTDADGSTTQEPAAAVTAPAGPGFVPGTLPSLLDPDALGKRNAALGLDPMLRYRAASALFQEVAMLDTYVRDAAVPYGYEAFVVRLQISVFPRQRYLPYDVYTTLAFPYGRQYVPAGEQADSVADGGAKAELHFAMTGDQLSDAGFRRYKSALRRMLTEAFSRDGCWADLSDLTLEAAADKVSALVDTQLPFKPGAALETQIQSRIRAISTTVWDDVIAAGSASYKRTDDTNTTPDQVLFTDRFDDDAIRELARHVSESIFISGWKAGFEPGYLDRSRPHREDGFPWPSRDEPAYGSYLDPIKVIPMLVTDNVESAIEARASSRIADISLQLQAVLSRGLAGNAGLRERLNEIQRALYRDYDSLMTVAGMTEDTVQVRFGARGMTQQEYDLDAVTQNVTLLLAVPAGLDFSSVDLAMASRVVDSKSGRELPSIGDEQLETRARDIFARLGRDLEPMLPDAADSDLLSAGLPRTGAFVYPPRDRDWWLRAYRAAEDGTFYGFAVAVLEGLWDGHAEGGDRACYPEAPFPFDPSAPVDADEARRGLRKTIESNRHVLYTAYTDLVSLAAKSSMKTVRVPLPPRSRRIDLPGQTVALFDDGKSMSATLSRVNGLESGREMAASLRVGSSPGIEIAATKLDVNASTGRVVLTFPTLDKARGIDKPTGDVELSLFARRLALPVGDQRRGAWERIDCEGGLKGRYVQSTKPDEIKPVAISLVSRSSTIEYARGDDIRATVVVKADKSLFAYGVDSFVIKIEGGGKLVNASIRGNSPDSATVSHDASKATVLFTGAAAKAGKDGTYHIDIEYRPDDTTAALTLTAVTSGKSPKKLSEAFGISLEPKDAG